MEIKNLTPHDITVLAEDGTVLAVIPASGAVARVSMTRMAIGTVAGLPAYRLTPGPVVGLPDPSEGVILIVSAMVREAVKGRMDVFSPGDLKRGPDGQPIGCVGLTGN